jgi:uncharacterized membrane protein
MKMMDEMDRNVKLRSESLGFKVAQVCLAIWGLFESWQTLSAGGQNGFNILPAMLLVVLVCVQSFSEMIMKRRMISGDDEYKEPNKFLRIVVAAVVIAAVVISIGSFVILQQN